MSLPKLKMKFIRRERVHRDKLKISPNNMRVDIPPDLSILRNSILAMGGTKDPLVVNPNYEIIEGQLRYLSSKDIQEYYDVLVCEFENGWEELKASFISNWARFPPSDEDKYYFVKKAVEEYGKTFAEISKETGVSESTLKIWYAFAKRPEPVREIEKVSTKKPEAKEALDKYAKLSLWTKDTVDKALEYAKDVDEAIEIIETVCEVPRDEIREITKHLRRGIPVDYEKRREIAKQKTVAFLIRVPEELYEKFIWVCKKEKLDPQTLMLQEIERIVKKYSE